MKIAKGWAFPDADEFMVGELQADGSYQRANLEKALEFVTDWTIAVDGGSHIGAWSRILSQRFERVIAVEPSADTREALVRNMAEFGCLNVEVQGVALGAAPGQVSMTVDEKGAAMKNTGARFVTAGGDVPLVTIDSWQLSTLGFLKLDVEGSEVAALQGAMKTLKRCKPVVLFESKTLWKRYGYHRDAPQGLLARLGYRQAAMVSRDEIWVPA